MPDVIALKSLFQPPEKLFLKYSQFNFKIHLKMKLRILSVAFALFFFSSIPEIKGEICPNVYFYFIGSSLTDYRNLTLGGSFSTLSSPYFDITKKTIFYAGGWLLNYDTFDAKTILGALQTNRKSAYNLVYIDWSQYTKEWFFVPMVNSTDCVGISSIYHHNILILISIPFKVANYVYQIISQMQTQLSLTPPNMYFVGFSFGAHLLGYTARQFTGSKVGRITGLDPGAALGFTNSVFETYSFVPLNSNDAT
jgi:hypothetical protein